MEAANLLDTKQWDYTFYSTDCASTNLSIPGVHHMKAILYSIYTIFVLLIAYMYGRHKGLSQRPNAKLFAPYKSIKSKLFELTSKIWFIVSTFVYPCALCAVWLFYSIHFDLHYLNDYNPWILPFILIYCLYSLVVIVTYLYYTDYLIDRCAKRSIKCTLAATVCVTVPVLYVLITNASNQPNRWSFEPALYGNHLLYCLNLEQHANPIVVLVFFILYCLLTHHLFVLLRAITAKFCKNEYIAKTASFRKRQKAKKQRRAAVKQMKRADAKLRAKGCRSRYQQDVQQRERSQLELDSQNEDPFNHIYVMRKQREHERRENELMEGPPTPNELNIHLVPPTPPTPIVPVPEAMEQEMEEPPQAYFRV